MLHVSLLFSYSYERIDLFRKKPKTKPKNKTNPQMDSSVQDKENKNVPKLIAVLC